MVKVINQYLHSGPDANFRPLKPEELEGHVSNLQQKTMGLRQVGERVETVGITNLHQEFLDLQESEQKKTDTQAAQKIHQQTQNQPGDSLHYDSARIPHYINASRVLWSKGDTEFIAAQSPLSNNVPMFLLMLIEQQVQVVLTLDKGQETPVPSGQQYWPTEEKTRLKIGKFMVTLKKITHKENYIYRFLQVKHSQMNMRQNVTQLHFTEWPEDGLPATDCFLPFFRAAHTAISNPRGPVVVHCSTGADRNATFIALHWLLARLPKAQELDVHEAVKQMQKSRERMLVSEHQLEYIYNFLLRYLKEYPDICKKQ